MSLIASCIAAHLIGLLTASGLTAREAVLIGALIGPMQVAGRVMEFMLGRHVGPIAAGTLSFAAWPLALAIFAVQSGNFALAVLFAVLYGWSNGVLTIVRGTVPAELFGREGYGALLGRLAMPQVIARAFAPAALAACWCSIRSGPSRWPRSSPPARLRSSRTVAPSGGAACMKGVSRLTCAAAE